jgi:hypothetical protein
MTIERCRDPIGVQPRSDFRALLVITEIAISTTGQTIMAGAYLFFAGKRVKVGRLMLVIH